MLGTSARLLTLLSLLQTRRDWPGQTLAERLRVTPRTIRRDVDRLRELGTAWRSAGNSAATTRTWQSSPSPPAGYMTRASTPDSGESNWDLPLPLRPYGFQATWNPLVAAHRIPGGIEPDPPSLLRALDELEIARALLPRR